MSTPPKLLRSNDQGSPIGRPERSNESGFTLLETIIALAIMLVTLASIMAVESNSLMTSARAKQLNVVAMLARNEMSEMEQKIEGKNFDEVKEEDGGAFDAPFEDYRWTSQIKEVTFPNLGMGSAQGAGGSEGGAAPVTDIVEHLTKLVTKYLSKSVREVNVTVFWKKGAKEQNF